MRIGGDALIEGWLEGRATAVAETLWVLPEEASRHTLYAVIDPDNAVLEFDEENNSRTLGIGGTDLDVSLISAQAQSDGSARIIAQVRNRGTPAAEASVLAILRGTTADAGTEPLATVETPSLAPGRLAQIAMDLPPGTAPEGESFYILFADETRVINDVNPENTFATFSVNLRIDSDGDGLPDWWEIAHELDPYDPSDALLDNDGDGLTNLEEYLAGTDPNDPDSFLRIETIGVGLGDLEQTVVEITWGSAGNRLYTLERSEDLRTGWEPLARHIEATPPVNVYWDVPPDGGSPRFYRIKVE